MLDKCRHELERKEQQMEQKLEEKEHTLTKRFRETDLSLKTEMYDTIASIQRDLEMCNAEHEKTKRLNVDLKNELSS